MKFLNDSVYSTLSADADLEAFESTYTENFETKAVLLKLNHPELHSEARSALCALLGLLLLATFLWLSLLLSLLDVLSRRLG
jgi:hypothetical protein